VTERPHPAVESRTASRDDVNAVQQQCQRALYLFYDSPVTDIVDVLGLSLEPKVYSMHRVNVENKGWSSRLERVDKAHNATVGAGLGRLSGPLRCPRILGVTMVVRASDGSCRVKRPLFPSQDYGDVRAISEETPQRIILV
jgi:hypothetical protein